MNRIVLLSAGLRRLSLLAATLLALLVAVSLPAFAEQFNPDGSPNPQASVPSQQQLLQEEPRIQGRIDIPNETASVLEQPAGRSWDFYHEVLLHWIGAVVILGMIALLALFYWLVGPLRMSRERAGIKVRRFSFFERFSHWLTAVSFITLAITGLNITFGKLVLLPLIGPDAFSSFSQIAKYTHDYAGFAFVLGFVLIVAMWMKDNIPRKVDIVWLKEGGGFVPSKHPPAGRFNAGEKLVFWFVAVGGAAAAVSGILLLFPFYITNIAGMQVAQIVHSLIAVAFIAVIIAHIYIGTLGTEGAFEAMGTGSVDLNWAKEHHALWLEEEIANGRAPDPEAVARPAE